jgi:hypothetical protein
MDENTYKRGYNDAAREVAETKGSVSLDADLAWQRVQRQIRTEDAAQACIDAITFLRERDGIVDGDIVDGLRDAGRLLLTLKAAGVEGMNA